MGYAKTLSEQYSSIGSRTMKWTFWDYTLKREEKIPNGAIQRLETRIGS